MALLLLFARFCTVVLLALAAGVAWADDAAKKRFQQEVVPVLIKKAQMGFVPKHPFWIKSAATAKNYKDGQQTVLQVSESESTFFDQRLANIQTTMSVNGRNYHFATLVNRRYVASLTKGNNEHFAMDGLILMKSAEGMARADSQSAEYFSLPLIYGLAGKPYVLVTEIFESPDFDFDVDINERHWTLNFELRTNEVKGDSREKCGGSIVFDSSDGWKIVEIVDIYNDKSKTVNKYSYGGEHSLFPDHRTGFAEMQYDATGELRRQSELRVVGSRTIDLPLERDACFLKYYGMAEPPEAQSPNRWILYISIAAALLSVAMLIYRKKTMRNK